MPSIFGPHDDTPPPEYDRSSLVAPPGYGFTGEDGKTMWGKFLANGKDKESFRLTDRSFDFIDRGIFNGKLRALIEQMLANRTKLDPLLVVDLGAGPIARAAHELVDEYGPNNVQVRAFDICKASDDQNPFGQKEGVRFEASDLTQGIPMEDGSADVAFSIQLLPHMAVNRETIELYRFLTTPADPFAGSFISWGGPSVPDKFPDYERHLEIIRETIRILKSGGQAMLDEDLLCRLPEDHPMLTDLIRQSRANCYAALQETDPNGRSHTMGDVTPYLHIEKL